MTSYGCGGSWKRRPTDCERLLAKILRVDRLFGALEPDISLVAVFLRSSDLAALPRPQSCRHELQPQHTEP